MNNQNISNTAIFFNADDLNVDSLKEIREKWDKPIFKADLWDSIEKTDFDLIKMEIKPLCDYYSELFDYIKHKEFYTKSVGTMPSAPVDIADKPLTIPINVKRELKKTVDVLKNYYSGMVEYESTFDEKNY